MGIDLRPAVYQTLGIHCLFHANEVTDTVVNRLDWPVQWLDTDL